MQSPRDREAIEQAVVRGSELLKQGKTELAQQAFRGALEAEPDNARVLALLGLSYFRAGELADARPIYEQLVERSPTDASHRLNLGLVYLKLNDADRAINSLEASRALDPSQGRAVNYLGLAYARAGRYAEAYRAFLIAGQNDLAIEIETNLGAAERDRIHSQLGRSPLGPWPEVEPALPRTPTPPIVARAPTPPVVARVASEPRVARVPTPTSGIPRTKPPSAPPRRTSQELAAEALSDDAALDALVTEAPPRRGFSESMQFVMPRPLPHEDGVPHDPLDGASMISRAVDSATPSPAPLISPARTRAGGTAPRPLSELATDGLIRPDDGDDVLEVSRSGALIIRVTERVLAQLDGVHITGGDLTYELAMRRSRGHNTDEPFGRGAAQLHAISGRGYLVAVPGKHEFHAVMLDDDILYLREDLVFAFEASLRWENGNVPGLRGKLPVVQFRGDGALALRLARPLVRVKLPAQGTVFIDAARLAGWIGRVIPRAVVPPVGGPLGAMCVECTGEGIVLIEPAPDGDAAVVELAPEPPPPPPPAPPVEAKLDLDDLLGALDEI